MCYDYQHCHSIFSALIWLNFCSRSFFMICKWLHLIWLLYELKTWSQVPRSINLHLLFVYLAVVLGSMNLFTLFSMFTFITDLFRFHFSILQTIFFLYSFLMPVYLVVRLMYVSWNKVEINKISPNWKQQQQTHPFETVTLRCMLHFALCISCFCMKLMQVCRICCTIECSTAVDVEYALACLCCHNFKYNFISIYASCTGHIYYNSYTNFFTFRTLHMCRKNISIESRQNSFCLSRTIMFVCRWNWK